MNTPIQLLLVSLIDDCWKQSHNRTVLVDFNLSTKKKGCIKGHAYGSSPSSSRA